MFDYEAPTGYDIQRALLRDDPISEMERGVGGEMRHETHPQVQHVCEAWHLVGHVRHDRLEPILNVGDTVEWGNSRHGLTICALFYVGENRNAFVPIETVSIARLRLRTTVLKRLPLLIWCDNRKRNKKRYRDKGKYMAKKIRKRADYGAA